MRNANAYFSLRALVVEDHAACRQVLTRLLRLEGIAVTSVSTGSDALAVAGRQVFDIVFTDLGLPDIPGSMLLRELVATARGRPHLVVISGAGEADLLEARRAGAETIFTKPFDWDTIRAYLRELRAAA